eukprot:10344079-Heterocapsa_arctica.AAC.1
MQLSRKDLRVPCFAPTEAVRVPEISEPKHASFRIPSSGETEKAIRIHGDEVCFPEQVVHNTNPGMLMALVLPAAPVDRVLARMLQGTPTALIAKAQPRPTQVPPTTGQKAKAKPMAPINPKSNTDVARP